MNAYATRVKTVSVQGSMEKICVPDALVQLKASHRLIERYFEAHFRSMQAAPDVQFAGNVMGLSDNRKSLRAICDAVTIHFSVVTLYFHPAVMFVMENPSEFAGESIVKYAKFKVLVSELEQASSATEQFEKVTELNMLFQHHVKEEESVVFPTLQASVLDFIGIGEMIYRAREHFENEFRGSAKREAKKKEKPYAEKASRRQRTQASLCC